MGENDGITRRRALAQAGAAGLGAAMLGSGLETLLAQVANAAPARGSLNDIEHVIIFIQENRSFDHYFGTLRGVRGFGDKRHRSVFTQVDGAGHRQPPFRLPHQCLPDLTHDWGPQHVAWNGGKMNRFLPAHEAGDGLGFAPETMGYYTRADIPLYYRIADLFTICDGYHCSVIGPTDPNRLMSMSATIDPAGTHGGPLVRTKTSGRTGLFSWTTMPERLSAHGVSWKVYSDPTTGFLDNVLTYFKQYSTGAPYSRPDLAALAFNPTFPAHFVADVAANRLPKVSWLLPSFFASEHPEYSAAFAGEVVLRQVLQTLFSHPKVWKKTALFVTWDENGGFFDHVAPPVPPKGTKGEYLTVANLPTEAQGIRGPIGLGFRVPMLVISPFSRGGLVCSDVFDHTSTLRFLETRFDVEVPNLSKWRRSVTGDLTSAFNFAAAPNSRTPALPSVSGSTTSPCPANPIVTPTKQPFPTQERGTRRRPSGLIPVACGSPDTAAGRAIESGHAPPPLC
jgi:phospholipase C